MFSSCKDVHVPPPIDAPPLFRLGNDCDSAPTCELRKDA